MRIPVNGTGFPIPEEIEVEAEVVLADPSKRLKAGIELTVTWVRDDGSEWGTKQHIAIEK